MFNCFFTYGQTYQQELPDAFEREYRYLDNNFNISISNAEFQSILKKSGSSIERIRNQRDSIAIILLDQYQDDYQAYMRAVFQITYTWKRLGYHLWLSEKEVRDIGKSLNIKHPYLLKDFMINNPNDKIATNVLNNLKKKLRKADIKFDSDIPTKELLNIGMRNSNARLLDLKDTPGHKKVCDDPNCCQKVD